MPSGLERGRYLLFHFRSIIGVARFNFSVRNGKRWSPCAIATLVRLSSCVVTHACKVERVLPEAETSSLALSRIHSLWSESDSNKPLFFAADSVGDDRSVVGGTCVPERVWVISIARL